MTIRRGVHVEQAARLARTLVQPKGGGGGYNQASRLWTLQRFVFTEALSPIPYSLSNLLKGGGGI